MTKFTSIMLALLAAGGIQAYAQNSFTHKATAARMKAVVKAGAAQLWKPSHEKEYEYMEGEWLEGGDYTYQYDKRGNALVTTYDDGYSKMRTTATYNDDNLWTEQITESADEGADFENSERKTRKYDPVVKDLVTELRTYSWDGTQWTPLGNANKRDISRDDDGKVKGVVISTWYNNEFTPVERTSVAYDELGLPGTWVHETLNAQNGWDEAQTLKAMTWHTTDYQVVTNDYMELFDGTNRLKKAQAWNAGVQTGSIAAKYDETGATNNRTIALTYLKVEGSDEPYGCDTIEYVYTDDNGSYTATQRYYTDKNGDQKFTADELTQTIEAKVMFDARGNNTLAESYEDGELTAGTKNEYAYDEATGAVKEMVTYEYNYDESQYEPFVKVVSDSFVDVTTAISAPTSGSSAAASDGVYTLQGIKVASTTDNLPSGIYIVKKAGLTVKTVRR